MTHAILLDLPDLFKGQAQPAQMDLFERQLASISRTANACWGNQPYRCMALAHEGCLAPEARDILASAGFEVSDLGRPDRTLAAGHAARLDEYLLAGYIKKLSRSGIHSLMIVSANRDLDALAYDFEGELKSVAFAQWDPVVSRRQRGGVMRLCLQDGLEDSPGREITAVVPPAKPVPTAAPAAPPPVVAPTPPPVTIVQTEVPLAAWIESLPFPLASILRRFLAERDAHLQNEHLFHFFEATAQFLTTLMLSAFHSDQAAFAVVRARLTEGSSTAPTLRSPPFGLWVTYGDRLAQETRRMLDQDQTHCERLFHSTNGAFLRKLAARELWDVLRTTLKFRNDWKGHGSVTSQPEKQRRLAALQAEMEKLRHHFGGDFDGYALIRPIQGTTQNGQHDYVVACLTGSHTVCLSETLRTAKLLESDRLYWCERATNQILALLPFVRVSYEAESSEHACFFYSRLSFKDEAWTARWVSYHHMERPEEQATASAALLKVVEDFTGPLRTHQRR